jgi:aminoglycoside 6'-N-acetyltransferase
LTDTALRYRRLARADFPLVAGWLAEPHVARWWRQAHSVDAVEAEYGGVVDGHDPTEVFIVEDDGRAIGLIQRYRLDANPDWQLVLAPAGTPADAFSLDYLIGVEDLTGRGIGPRMIAGCVAEGFELYPDLSAAVVAVQQDNRASWRALEKAGFQRAWSGQLESDDPSDAGPSHIYVLLRSDRRRDG